MAHDVELELSFRGYQIFWVIPPPTGVSHRCASTTRSVIDTFSFFLSGRCVVVVFVLLFCHVFVLAVLSTCCGRKITVFHLLCNCTVLCSCAGDGGYIGVPVVDLFTWGGDYVAAPIRRHATNPNRHQSQSLRGMFRSRALRRQVSEPMKEPMRERHSWGDLSNTFGDRNTTDLGGRAAKLGDEDMASRLPIHALAGRCTKFLNICVEKARGKHGGWHSWM